MGSTALLRKSITCWNRRPRVTGTANPAGYLISHRVNDSFILMNRLLAAKCDVYWLKQDQTADGEDLGTGAIW